MRQLKTSGINRREMVGSLFLASGALLSGCGLSTKGNVLKDRGRTLIDGLHRIPRGLAEAVRFPLIEALYGRRARRFAKGNEIPDGPLKFKSKHAPQPLSELEQMMLFSRFDREHGLSPYDLSKCFLRSSFGQLLSSSRW